MFGVGLSKKCLIMLNGLNICMYAVLLYTLDFKTLTHKKHEVGSLESTREAYELLEAQPKATLASWANTMYEQLTEHEPMSL